MQLENNVQLGRLEALADAQVRPRPKVTIYVEQNIEIIHRQNLFAQDLAAVQNDLPATEQLAMDHLDWIKHRLADP